MENNKVFQEEEQHKENVYCSLDGILQKDDDAVVCQIKNCESGKYEDQAAFIEHKELTRLQGVQKRNQILKGLYNKPYFAHVMLNQAPENKPIHYYLSDNEQLDDTVRVSGDSYSFIIPFKYLPDHPLVNKVRIFYAAPSNDPIIVSVLTKYGTTNTTTYVPELCRKVDILHRKLRKVESLFSANLGDTADEVEVNESVNADDILSQILQKNRSDAQLRNIISTLQKKQYEIIQTDKSVSFVFQGCAGSGKTQCLIHRLFFLRESLSANSWDHVLLVTPTQLFRNYSSDIMRRYRLSDVANCSLAELYVQLLHAFDQRFKNRQYQFELTEEYLPDEYLQQVYSPQQIHKIETEIHNAIRKHFAEGCQLVGIGFDEKIPITIDMVNDVTLRITEAIQRFDEAENALSEIPEYQEHRNAINELDRQLRISQRKQTELLGTKAKLEALKAQYDQLKHDLDKANIEKEEWESYTEQEIATLLHALAETGKAADSVNALTKLSQAASEYAMALYSFEDATGLFGKRARYVKEYLELLEAIKLECQEALVAFTKPLTPAAWLRNQEQRRQINFEHLSDVETDIELNLLYQEDHIKWLQEFSIDDVQKQRQNYREALEHSRYYLSRIESSVFEQEVWNALSPLKEVCAIQTLQIEQQVDGRQKQTRILYKSDLLFYLKIYSALHTTKALPDYTLICIDEGQDLHKADYIMMHKIYPRAIMNVFGDVGQVLHESCGISSWKKETQIDTVYEIRSNYRSEPAIVDFCNKHFETVMEYCGTINIDRKPVIVETKQQLKQVLHDEAKVVIVKDKHMFDLLCHHAEGFSINLEYIDTKTDVVPEGKVACYSIFAAKGLEFTTAMVFADAMTRNQKTVACTRAMNKLFYCEWGGRNDGR